MSLTLFSRRHIGPSHSDKEVMLKSLGYKSLDDLIDDTLPSTIRYTDDLDIPDGVSEESALAELSKKMDNNLIITPMIGQGYYGTRVPPVISRNMLENPAWYTAYTPYQPEISQGRLEMLFHYQTLVAELTNLPVVNASLLDEATALAEAMTMSYRHLNRKRSKCVIANSLHPQSIGVLETRAKPLGIEISHINDAGESTLDEDTFALIVQLPDTYGDLTSPDSLIKKAKKLGVLVILAADPLWLVLCGRVDGVDICVGSLQRFGVPLMNGGPHAAFMATTEDLTRLLVGRLIGESIDAHGRPAYRLALQTREQHIRRDKATSNICTAQALLANMSAAYAIWHGPDGLYEIAEDIHILASRFADSLLEKGYELQSNKFFDTLTIIDHGKAQTHFDTAISNGIIIRRIDSDRVSIAFDETTEHSDLVTLSKVFGTELRKSHKDRLPKRRDVSKFLTQEIFNHYSSETELMRLLRRLADKDLALDRAMIPLGSCTMKLNAAAEMIPITWRKCSNVHPLSPVEDRRGYGMILNDLDRWLSEITGFTKVSFQPNAGSQGEYAGLLAIAGYHQSNDEGHRNICLIPSSSHGTNPASAQMVGYDVVVVECTENGDVSLDDLREKAQKHSKDLAALMITYPSTHGVFEEGIRDICDLIHSHGGQVYLDGANLNAMVGLARPGDIGGDVCHMNLHKTFCIPHGGGGPGVGPIGVAAHLVPHLPGHYHEGDGQGGAVSSAPYGSAGILPISWMYIHMLGGDGLTEASKIAILNANYIAERLSVKYPILYRGATGRVAHECIVDTRVLKDKAGITVDDVAKRLMDYGFHAPTMSWPVAGTLMVEPTESEPLEEIDRFIDAMLSIADEADQVAKGVWTAEDNPLVNAPHTAQELLKEEWTHPYSREVAAFPKGIDPASKYWVPVSRVDNIHGDRNLICTCPPLEDYMDKKDTLLNTLACSSHSFAFGVEWWFQLNFGFTHFADNLHFHAIFLSFFNEFSRYITCCQRLLDIMCISPRCHPSDNFALNKYRFVADTICIRCASNIQYDSCKFRVISIGKDCVSPDKIIFLHRYKPIKPSFKRRIDRSKFPCPSSKMFFKSHREQGTHSKWFYLKFFTSFYNLQIKSIKIFRAYPNFISQIPSIRNSIYLCRHIGNRHFLIIHKFKTLIR